MNGAGAVTGAELARLWSAAPALLVHAQSCACCSGAGIVIDPAAVEADILDYLTLKYADAGAKALSDFVSARRTTATGSFALWLSGLDDAALQATDIARLKVDLATTLYSMR